MRLMDFLGLKIEKEEVKGTLNKNNDPDVHAQFPINITGREMKTDVVSKNKYRTLKD